ncbi:hypothetical protein M0804_009037 [Polistes exclamans]|nr:hypothetical protein M0804_009037 [Polistes exclamans]
MVVIIIVVANNSNHSSRGVIVMIVVMIIVVVIVINSSCSYCSNSSNSRYSSSKKSSDEEEIRFPRNRNVNRIITSSNSNSDIDQCNRNDTECDEDSNDKILQELVIDEERKTNDTEENTIEFSVNVMNLVIGRSHFLLEEQAASLCNYQVMLIHLMCLSCSLMTK